MPLFPQARKDSTLGSKQTSQRDSMRTLRLDIPTLIVSERERHAMTSTIAFPPREI